MTALLLVVVLGLGWAIAAALKDRWDRRNEPPRFAPPPPPPAPPKELKVKIVDAGSMRFVDLRPFSADALQSAQAMAGVGKSLAALPAIACVCYVMPRAFASLLSGFSDVAQNLMWSWLKSSATPGSMMIATYVDGAKLDPRHTESAKRAGVEVLLEWPVVTGQDPNTGEPRSWTGEVILASSSVQPPSAANGTVSSAT
jgi:hypothetical protein